MSGPAATRRSALGGALALSLGAAAPAPSSAPRRVVSLNPCLDLILLAVADRGQIAALSHFSPKAEGYGAAGRALPFTYESAEEVVALKPDLVLASRFTDAATRRALARLGVRLELFDQPGGVDQSLAQIRRVAEAIGRPQAGQREIARIQAAIAAAAPATASPAPTALVFQRDGFASGPDTLVDEMLTRAGLSNMMRRYGMARSSNLPLELVIAHPPQIILSGASEDGRGDRVLNHPALARLKGRILTAAFPQRLVYCAGPNLVETAQRLAAARQAFEARP